MEPTGVAPAENQLQPEAQMAPVEGDMGGAEQQYQA
mgnify:CR=1 FL=1